MDIGFGIWQQLILLIIAVLAILPVIAIIDIVKGEFAGRIDKLIGILVVLFLNALGSLLYFIIGEGQRIKEAQTNRLSTDS